MCFMYAPRFVTVVSGLSPCSRYGWWKSHSAARLSLAKYSSSSRSFAVSAYAPAVSTSTVIPLSSAFFRIFEMNGFASPSDFILRYSVCSFAATRQA